MSQKGRGEGGPEDRDTLPSRGPAGAVAVTATASKIAKNICTAPFAIDCIKNSKKHYMCSSFYNNCQQGLRKQLYLLILLYNKSLYLVVLLHNLHQESSESL